MKPAVAYLIFTTGAFIVLVLRAVVAIPLALVVMMSGTHGLDIIVPCCCSDSKCSSERQNGEPGAWSCHHTISS